MSGEIIAIVAVGVALAGVIFAWKTSQKNGELSVEMEKRTREHRAFANRFSVITDVEAEAQSAQEKLATVKATHVAEKRFRRLDAPHLLKDVFEGRKFEDGKPVSTQQRKNAA